MYILTKRTAPSDKGSVMHSIHGYTKYVEAARAWFRATRTTDVIEVEHSSLALGAMDKLYGNFSDSVISDKRFMSWREAQLRDELETAKALSRPSPGGCSK